MNIEDILEIFKEKIEAINPIDKKYLISKGNQNGFEELVPIIAEEIKKDINNTNIFDFESCFQHHFPDMNLIVNQKLYGLELKSKKDGTWSTPGNSVFESISEEDYCEIYLLFGSKEKDKDHILVRYCEYWRVTRGIAVTHSPRFKINMDGNDAVFKSAKEYHDLKNMSEKQKIQFLQNYLKTHTSEAKWFVPQSDTVLPTKFEEIPSKDQANIIAEMLVLFPQDLFKQGRSNYQRVSQYLITTYFYYTTNVRDKFSASGKWHTHGVEFPHVVSNIDIYKNNIHKILLDAEEDFKKMAYENWSELPVQLTESDFSEDYKKVLNYIGKQEFQEELQQSKIELLANLLQ